SQKAVQPGNGLARSSDREQLRADVDVEPVDLAPERRGLLRSDPELRAELPGADRLVRVSLDAGCDADEHPLDTGTPGAVELLERVEDDVGRSCVDGRRELRGGLVVAGPDEPVAGETCALCEAELAQCRDVRAEALVREYAHDPDVREGLRPVHDERPRSRGAVGARPRADR